MFRFRPSTTALLCTGAALFALPAAAQAAGTASVSGGDLTVTAESGKNNAFNAFNTGGGFVVVEDAHALTASTGCVQLTTERVACSLASSATVTINAGNGNDSIRSEVEQDTFLIGGDGVDTIAPLGTGQDIITGGAGSDKVTYEELSVPVALKFNGTADDGPISGTPDFIASDIEIGVGGSGDDVLVGASSAPTILYGGAGDDTLVGGSAADVLAGEAGDDVLNVADGATHDIANCGDGNDSVMYDTGDFLVDASACENKFPV